MRGVILQGQKAYCRVRNGLLQHKSVLSDAQLWTSKNLADLETNFINNPQLGDERFLQKLNRQLRQVAPPVAQLAAELLWLLFLFPSNITGAKKRQNVMEVWSWSNSQLRADHELVKLLDYGIGSAGQAYNNRRDSELAFAIKLVQRWKSESPDRRSALATNPWEFGSWIDEIPEGARRQFRHIVLYVLFPDYYERIASGRHKDSIVSAFGDLPGVSDEISALPATNSERLRIDEALLAVRKVLEHQNPGREIDFYEPPAAEKWRRPEASAHEQPASAAISDEEDTSRNVWIEKTIIKGRLDREKGPNSVGVALWSPQRSRNGADIYSNMPEVHEGAI